MWLLRLFLALPRFVLRHAAWLLLAVSLSFSAMLLTVSSVYTAASAALSAVGVTTVAAREAAAKATRAQAQRRVARQTTQRVTRRVQRSAARNIGSAAGEAIPVIGVGVIAGALALEVRDACATAQEMAGLEAALMTEGDPDEARQRAEEAFDCTAMIRAELPGYEDLPTREDLWAQVRTAPETAYDAARDAGVALAEIDWPKWAGAVVRWTADRLDVTGGPAPPGGE